MQYRKIIISSKLLLLLGALGSFSICSAVQSSRAHDRLSRDLSAFPDGRFHELNKDVLAIIFNASSEVTDSNICPIEFVSRATQVPSEWGDLCDMIEDPATNRLKILTCPPHVPYVPLKERFLSSIATFGIAACVLHCFAPNQKSKIVQDFICCSTFFLSIVGLIHKDKEDELQLLVCDFNSKKIESRLLIQGLNFTDKHKAYFLDADTIDICCNYNHDEYRAFRKNTQGGFDSVVLTLNREMRAIRLIKKSAFIWRFRNDDYWSQNVEEEHMRYISPDESDYSSYVFSWLKHNIFHASETEQAYDDRLQAQHAFMRSGRIFSGLRFHADANGHIKLNEFTIATNENTNETLVRTVHLPKISYQKRPCATGRTKNYASLYFPDTGRTMIIDLLPQHTFSKFIRLALKNVFDMGSVDTLIRQLQYIPKRKLLEVLRIMQDFGCVDIGQTHLK